MQEHLSEYFKSESHSGFLGIVSITFIDKTDDKDPKKRENYQMWALKTYATFGFELPMHKYKCYCRVYLSVIFWYIGYTRYRFKTRFFGHDIYFLYLLYCLFPYC